ncbi:hypothetical protein F4805DRAFT_221303 [Annulohypoxylon moriforme]|nr:hypothetical protein F4805DRAFT_221303 [Annulohypoxylon moriforme]
MIMNSGLLLLCWGLIPIPSFCMGDQFDPNNYSSDDVITSDVAVIGGGSSGTYAAIMLRKLGKTVSLVERESMLGGPTHTYIDPITGTSIDYGVQAFSNTSVTRDYFAHFNISITNFAGDPLTITHADFQTGKLVDFESSTNFSTYIRQLEKYPYLEYGWNLPTSIPGDLLLSFTDFIAKYNLQNIAYSIFSDAQGFSNILEQLTINVMKIVPKSYVENLASPDGTVVTSNRNNSELYTKALAELNPNVLLSSTVVAAQRPNDTSSGVRLVVETPSGRKLIRASKLLISIPPLLDNMSPFDLEAFESALFSQWAYSRYYSILVNNTGLPSGFRFENANASTSTFHIPSMPAPYHVTETRIPGLFYIWYGSPYTLTQARIEADVISVIERLRPTLNSTSHTQPQFVEFKDNTPFKLTASADTISQGFYDKLESLQGRRSTWYTGAAFITHEAPILWNFTQSLIHEMIAN